MTTTNSQGQKINKPDYVVSLEGSYGAPSQSGWGSAVFFEHVKDGEDLEKAALEKYQYFVGELWDRFGEDAWMSAWKQVYTRPSNSKPDIVAELKNIADFEASQSVPMILDVIQNADQARATLALVYDHKDVVDLMVYNLGDGGAMLGLSVVGRRKNGETTFLLFIYD